MSGCLKCLKIFHYYWLTKGDPLGLPLRKFGASRRLRTPLSPFIFTLVVDCLIQMVDRARERHLIGLCVGREEVEISHLQFTHDTTFFLSKGNQILANLSTVIESFCGYSGLKN